MMETPNLKENSIKELQTYVAAKIVERGFEDESLHERLLMLTEEVGELAKACRKISKMYVDKDREITSTVGHEIADVINMLFAVGIELNIDIEKEFRDKEAINNTRTYERSKATK